MDRRVPHVFDAGNAARRMIALSELGRSGQIPLREAVDRIAAEAAAWVAAVQADRTVGPEDVALGLAGALRGLFLAHEALHRRGPVVVRWIDPEGLIGVLLRGGDDPPMGNA